MRIYKEKNGKIIIDLEYNSLITNSIKIELENDFMIKNGIVYTSNSEDYNITKKDKESQFKQGDKVLVSDNGVIWEKREFIMQTIRGSFCFSKDYSTARWYGYIKPYEEEIKVGDWVKYDNQVFRVNGKELSSFLLECIKITNPQLIELLNKEL